MLDAAIFDMDGILFDTENLYCDAWRSASAKGGYALDDETIFACIGRNLNDTRAIMTAACGADFPFDESHQYIRAWTKARMQESGPPEKIGVRVLLDYFSIRGVPIALATSTSEETARWMIETAGLTHYFSGWAFGNEVTNGKPKPDIFLLAQSRLGVADSAKCVVFEDSPAGLNAAISAGMKAVFVRDLVSPSPDILARVWKQIPSLDVAASDTFYADL